MDEHTHTCKECDMEEDCDCEECPYPLLTLCYRCEMAERKATQYAGWKGTPEGDARAARYARS